MGWVSSDGEGVNFPKSERKAEEERGGQWSGSGSGEGCGGGGCGCGEWW